MAKGTKPKTDGEPVEKPAPIQSLSEVQSKIEEQKATDRERVLATAPTAGVKAETPPPPVEETPPPAEPPEELTPEKYTAWFESQPESMRVQFATNVIDANSRQLAEYYGPEVSAILAEVKADPKLAKIFKALTAKEKREWLADTALDIYEDPKYAPAPDENAPDPRYTALETEVKSLKETLTKGEQQKLLESYQSDRRDEYTAFLAKFPQLNYDTNKVRFTADGADLVPAPGVEKSDPDFKRAKRTFAIVNRAEEQSRKIGRKISYADVGIEMLDMWDAQEANPPSRPVPNVSSKEIPSPQAPRTKVEVRQRLTEQISKHGNVTNLARALRS